MGKLVDGDFEAHLRALGSLVVNYSSIELGLARIAWILINPREDRQGQIVVHTIGVARVAQLVEGLIPLTSCDVVVRDRLLALVAKFRSIQSRRNDYIHAHWRVPNDATDLQGVQAAKPPTRNNEEYLVVDDTASADRFQARSTTSMATL